MINKEVQKLAQSTVYSYENVLILYEYYKDIEVVKAILEKLTVSTVSIYDYIKLLNGGIDIYGVYNFLKE